MNIEIYGQPGCQYCAMSKDLVQKLKADEFIDDYTYIDYVKEGKDKTFLDNLTGTDVKSVPVIMMNGRYIGGYQDLKNKFAAA